MFLDERRKTPSRMVHPHTSLLSGVKGCHSWGHTFNEALINIQEAVQLCVEYLIESGDDVSADPEKSYGT
jgi:hypothetical protein